MLMMNNDNHRIHLGVVRYAREARWILDSRLINSRRFPEAWRGDGIVALLSNGSEGMTRLQQFNVPIVNMEWDRKSDMPCVINDDHAIGRLGAEHLISRGFQDIGFVSNQRAGGGIRRFAGFRAAVEEAGRVCHHLPIKRLHEMLQELPKPLALMGMDDGSALRVQYVCEDLGLLIPQEVAVMGANDDPLRCELAPVPLTSVHHNQDARGYTAAKLLDSILDGELAPTEPIYIQPQGVTVRQSTDIQAIPHVPTATGLHFIADRFSDGITPADVAVAAGMSRRHLDQMFRKHIGWTVDEEIRRRRLELAKRLLRESDWKYAAIAFECGFSGAMHFYRTFQRKEGMTPKQYRKQLSQDARNRATSRLR